MPVKFGPRAPEPAALWTADAWTALPDDGRGYQVVDGALLVSPAPGEFRRAVVRRLADLLTAAVPPGAEVAWDTAVAVGASLLVPDLVVLRTEGKPNGDGPRRAVLPSEVLLTVMVAELSAATTARITAPALFAAAGIPAYWRVDVEPEPAVVVFRLVSDRYTVEGRLRGDQTQTVTTPFQVTLRPRRLLAPVAGEVLPDEVLARLRQLADLRDAGILTPMEYDEKRATLMAARY